MLYVKPLTVIFVCTLKVISTFVLCLYGHVCVSVVAVREDVVLSQGGDRERGVGVVGITAVHSHGGAVTDADREGFVLSS